MIFVGLLVLSRLLTYMCAARRAARTRSINLRRQAGLPGVGAWRSRRGGDIVGAGWDSRPGGGRVLHASLRAIARVDREYLAGNLLGNFEGELKTRRGLAEKPLPEALGRKLIEGEVAANGREDLSVFAQTLRFEGLLREAAAAQIIRPGIDLVD